MNKGILLQSNLIGDEESVETLAQKETSHILVLSDTHDHPNAVHKIFKTTNTVYDALIFCGDGIQDILGLFAWTLIDSDIKEKLPPVISFVSGNMDLTGRYRFRNLAPATDSSVPFYITTELPLTQTLCASGMNIFSAHGHTYGVKYDLNNIVQASKEFNSDIILYGHTHIAGAEYYEKTLILNPGCFTSPKGGTTTSYAELFLNKEKHSADYLFCEIK